MKQLKYFISGILFYIIVIPVIESIGEILTTLLEIPKGKASAPVLKINKELQELQVDLEKHDDAVCMGFDITTSDDYYEDEDDFEYKRKLHKSRRL